ncbi:ABC transporter substrate-binding protein [Alkalihalobacillus oceani]|uniref:ABC transporter substrate-binding protein n=1 Tax=Halalkalibacter oceani TaxID=1653776 RepID=A0A9X2ILZ3_9BACI|nr:ABC transporter substrate-binding protein [Halalkalibacter oceani]MCM3712535.1 ABC transporter substrate-binding protein [Halalkalibacter oceani]
MKVKSSVLLITIGFLVMLAACSGGNEAEQSAPEPNDQPAEQQGAAEENDEAATEPLGTMKVGLVCGGMTPLLAQIGINDGSFAAEGLEVEEICFSSGADAVQALVGGSIDANLGSYEHVLRFADNELDVKTYGQLYNGASYSLVVKEDAPFQDISELAGETIAVTRAGSLSDTALRKGFEGTDIDPDRDVEIIGSGSGATMLAAIENNQVAGGMVSEPTVSQMVATGDYRVLYDPDFDYAGIVVMSMADWVDEHSREMETFLKVMLDIYERSVEDPASVVEVMQGNFPEVPPDVLQMAIEAQLSKVPDGLRVTEAGAENVVETAIELGVIEQPVSYEEAVDLSYLP